MKNEEIWEKIKDNEIQSKLLHLHSILIRDSRLKSYQISVPDYSFPQDPTIWVNGFKDGIRAQVKMQLTGKTVIVNIRPTAYNTESRTKFKKLMTGLGFEIGDENNKIYAPTADKALKQEFPRGFDSNETGQIISHLMESINRICNNL